VAAAAGERQQLTALLQQLQAAQRQLEADHEAAGAAAAQHCASTEMRVVARQARVELGALRAQVGVADHHELTLFAGTHLGHSCKHRQAWIRKLLGAPIRRCANSALPSGTRHGSTEHAAQLQVCTATATLQQSRAAGYAVYFPHPRHGSCGRRTCPETIARPHIFSLR
jgi:hypothetical protein